MLKRILMPAAAVAIVITAPLASSAAFADSSATVRHKATHRHTTRTASDLTSFSSSSADPSSGIHVGVNHPPKK